jgi:hypothetical protein
MAVPFQSTKNGKKDKWKAVVNGKVLILCDETETRETAVAALAKLLSDSGQPNAQKKPGIMSLFQKSENKAPQDSTSSTDLTDSLTPTSDDKPKPGEFRKNGLSELSSVKLNKFREQIAIAIASGNVSLDRALVSIFRDKVPVIPAEQYMLLSTGWELACEQFFVNGVPPWWIVVLLGNATVIAGMVEKSDPKKLEEEDQIAPDGNVHFRSPQPQQRPTKDK